MKKKRTRLKVNKFLDKRRTNEWTVGNSMKIEYSLKLSGNNKRWKNSRLGK